MKKLLPRLFSEIKLGNTLLKNRIVSTGHHTYLADKKPGEALIAYHERRARGGVGLIVSEIIAVHDSAGFSRQLLSFEDPDSVAEYRKLVEACHRHDCKIFAQLFHPGREILSSWSGFAPIAYAPSAVANERFHIMPKAMPVKLIEEIIDGFASCASKLAEAGFDGVEIVGSHGYLPAQFLSPAVNKREDAYGGDGERRLAFVQQVISSIRQQAPELTLGLRLSANDHEPDGLDEAATADICVALEPGLDYLSLVAGSSATLGASVHITPAMGFDSAYVAKMSKAIKQKVDIPIIVTGRINQPQVAEQVIANGQADLCGMTRAMICDAEMPNKAEQGQFDDIRACIGCNQACIGRAHKGLTISCIQHPESGRELQFREITPAASPKQIMIIGAGPAGMKAAAVAAVRGHRVSLYDKESQPGGQALLAQRLPGRDEFGGIVTNLLREVENAGVELISGCEVNAEMIQAQKPDHVILATGARVNRPDIDSLDENRIASYEDILLGRIKAGNRVAIADWRADWIGLGLAEKLALDGCQVHLMVNAAMAGESLQMYTRNHYVGRLYKLGVEIITHARLFGSDGESIYFQNTLTDEAIIVEADTLVYSLGQQPENHLEAQLGESGIELSIIGDCLLPRTAEEAVYEGLMAAWEL
jgi:2,4-dienoyl-CoA reductase-like NADH-dependent reductase (Old Yellow Enzyme family)/thioredoxin reductase